MNDIIDYVKINMNLKNDEKKINMIGLSEDIIENL